MEPPENDERSDPSASIASAIGHIGEIVASLHTLLALRAERRRLAVRRYVLFGIAVVLVAVALVPLIIAGVNLLVTGMAQGFTVFWDGRVWLGNLSAGAVILGGLVALGMAASFHVSRKQMAKKVAQYGDLDDEDGDAAETDGRQEVAPASHGTRVDRTQGTGSA